MSELKSKFGNDLRGFISLKEAFGNEKKAFLPHLRSFDVFCCMQYPESEYLTREIILAWLAKKGETSQNRSESHIIRQFGIYLTAIGKPAYVIQSNFVLSKSDFTPYIATNAELLAFFEATDSLKYSKHNPNAHIIAPVLFRLLYTCGLRPNEGRELKTQDINLQTGEIIIRHNKQHKERIVVMSDDMLRLCNAYNAYRKILSCESVYFFPAFKDKPFSNQSLWRLHRICWKIANPGVPEDKLPSFRPYDFRHCFASRIIQRWLDEGREIESMISYLRAYMGHVTFNSTIYYVHLMPENLVNSSGINLSAFEKILPEVNE